MLSDRVEAALVRGVGAYLRAADVNELPPQLRRLRSFRPTALGRHKGEVLGALDLAATRGLILQWLDEDKPRLPKEDVATLRRAAEAGEGWRERLAEGMPPRAAPDTTQEDLTRLRAELERERTRASRAREGERAARERLVQGTKEAGAKAAVQEREINRLSAQIAELQRELDGSRAEAARASEARSGEQRRAERAVEKERRARQEAEGELKRARRELRQRDAELAQARRELENTRNEGARPQADGVTRAPGEEQPGTRKRSPLPVPLGRLEEDPKTLSTWLDADGVQLLVDGYNVSKSVTGFGHLTLEDQRKRVVHAVNRLARKHGLRPVIVFDGTETSPGTFRRLHGPAVVEYSAGETADDHLIARLERLPPQPVIVVTNDKELQQRASALRATVASSDQLLALAR